MAAEERNDTAAIVAAAAYVLVWCAAVAYLALAGRPWIDAVEVMGVFGVGCGAVAWLLTRGADAPAVAVKRPAFESAAVLVYLGFYAVFFLVYGMSAARQALPPGQAQEVLVLALKLGVHVALPCIVLWLLGERLKPLFQAGLRGGAFWRTLLVMGAIFVALLSVISPSLENIHAAHASLATLVWIAPVSFIWIAVEAGLNEEFLFRAVLQTRLSAWLRSPVAGVVLTALLFGLAHAPGLYLRGGPELDGWSSDPLVVAAGTIATLSPMGLLLGLIYARTKSLLLVVLLHGAIDVLPNMSEFIRIWA
jgi:membrane protease YdiL (CAAX protease family)